MVTQSHLRIKGPHYPVDYRAVLSGKLDSDGFTIDNKVLISLWLSTVPDKKVCLSNGQEENGICAWDR